jgi:hypothetical protein
MKKLILIPVALLLVAAAADEYRDYTDHEEVRQAVLDYVEGLYEVDPARIERSVHPDLAKRGYYIPRGSSSYENEPMTYQQLYDLAGKWNENGNVDAETAPKEVIVYDVLDQTASVKLVAQWGVDYIHLGKYDGKWKIVNVLWQTPPKEVEGQ